MVDQQATLTGGAIHKDLVQSNRSYCYSNSVRIHSDAQSERSLYSVVLDPQPKNRQWHRAIDPANYHAALLNRSLSHNSLMSAPNAAAHTWMDFHQVATMIPSLKLVDITRIEKLLRQRLSPNDLRTVREVFDHVLRETTVAPERVEIDRIIASMHSANGLLSLGKRHAAFDTVFDSIDAELRERHLKRVDSVLDKIDVESVDRDILIAMLTATLPAREHLSNRQAFYQRVASIVTAKSRMEPGLLEGLE